MKLHYIMLNDVILYYIKVLHYIYYIYITYTYADIVYYLYLHIIYYVYYVYAHIDMHTPIHIAPCVCEFERTKVDNSQSRPATHRCRAQRVPCSVPKLLRPGLWMSQWLSFFGSVWPWPTREYLMFLHCFNCSIGPSGIFGFIFVLEGKWKTCHHQGHIYTLFFQNKDTTCISTQRSQR